MRVSVELAASRIRQRGLTLVELMVTISILAALFFLAIPDIRSWIQNTRMRTVAEALQNGIRLAQAESVRRNRTVVFFLTNAEPSLAAAAVDDGANWGLRPLPIMASDDVQLIRGGAFSDIAPGASIRGPAAICFNAAGQQVTVAAEGCAPAAWSYLVTLTGAERRMRVDVGMSGRVRMCDPDKVLSATNPDGC